MIDYSKFPEYFTKYVWSGKHTLYGYPSDTFPDFNWIASLEKRFQWVVENYDINNSASKYLLQEMIEWGGSQNGVLQKFNDSSGEVNLLTIMGNVVNNLPNPEQAISSALRLPGLGLTYASKLLRFMHPDKYGALDSRIRKALHDENILQRIFDGNHNSMVSGYVQFVSLLAELKNKLAEENIEKPSSTLNNDSDWRACEIEMALFYWAENR